jgi:hypothetical protein
MEVGDAARCAANGGGKAGERRPRSILLSASEAQATLHAHDAEPD